MKKFLSAVLLVLALAPAAVSAQTSTGSAGACSSPQTTVASGQSYASSTSEQLGKCVSQIYLWSLGVGGVLALIMIVLGGYYVMTAAGNAAQVSKGKSYIYSSLIGLAILLGAYLILSTINPDLVSFRVNLDSLGGQ
jgi:hypothetical protein